uniref:Protein odr-4 homolog n=1 Tax=Neogobius melanostomus TaxID=47308 RepID=A0A8C6V5L4_9GOBI
MGRGYIVEDAVESYLSQLCDLKSTTITGLLIGQSSAQRDYVVMASRTPPKDDSTGDCFDRDWVTEHARQVSRMLPGGLSVLGVFTISETDAKDTLITLRQLVFSVDNLISSERLWSPADDDVTDCVTLHINSKTRKTVCRTFDVKDPKSIAKPADWKYQSGVCSSWITVSCCLNVNMYLPLPTGKNTAETMEKCIKEELEIWAQKIENGVFLLDGKKLPEDAELTTGQVNTYVSLVFMPQLFFIIFFCCAHCFQCEQRQSDVVQKCGGSVSIRGTIHSRAHVHSNKPKARHALKRDMICTVATRVQMLLEELATSGGNVFSVPLGELLFPRRIFCPMKGRGPICVCDYQFSDEGPAEATERLKEMLDIDAEDDDIDMSHEITPENINTETADSEVAGELFSITPVEEKTEDSTPQKSTYIGKILCLFALIVCNAYGYTP